MRDVERYTVSHRDEGFTVREGQLYVFPTSPPAWSNEGLIIVSVFVLNNDPEEIWIAQVVSIKRRVADNRYFVRIRWTYSREDLRPLVVPTQ